MAGRGMPTHARLLAAGIFGCLGNIVENGHRRFVLEV